jgi:glycosyltransferase involved in cell wall biosynthesis
LIDNGFNCCKSWLKVLEYSSVGLPSICSNVVPYNRIIEQGVNGWLVNNEEEWEEASRCISPKMRQKAIELGLEHSWQRTINQNKWMEVFQTLC